MSEMAKTGIFAGVALLVSLGAVLTRPALPLAPESAVKLGEPLFADFDDPSKGASLEVVERKESGKVETFKVGKVDGRWVLTSYKNYPADAVSRLKDFASMLLGAKIIDVIQPDLGKDGKPVSEAEHQETYGVIAPDAKTTKDDKGIGTLITLRDSAGAKLASLVVGIKAEEVGAAPLGAQPKEKRFVRRDGESTVFVAEFDSSKLSTNYADWMEKLNLLKEKTASGGQDSLSDKVERATLRDFAIGSAAPSPSPAQALSEIKLTWKQSDFKWHLDEVLERRGGQLAPFTMLTSEELNTERLDDLKRALDELKFIEVEPKPAGGLDANLRATVKLMQDQAAIDKLAKQGFMLRDGQLYGSGGELVLLTKDGVEYVLRFGGTQDLPPAAAKAGDPVKQGRYLLLAARTNTSIIPLPVFDPLPAADIGPAAPGAEPKPGVETPKEDKEGKEPKAADLAKKKAEREAIEKKNKRLQDDYDQKLKDAEKAVRELNFRFADWYYVVADEAYQKLHLTRPDVVREKKDARETGFEIDSFRDLEDGPKKKEAALPPNPHGGFPPGGGFPGRPPF